MKLKVLENIDINLPSDVIELTQRLSAIGIDSYIVGGAVRNFLLGYDFVDVDIYCRCSKEFFINKEIKDIEIDYEFDNVILATVFINDWISFSQSISFNKDFEDDYMSRDYSINAIWYNLLEKKLLGFDKSFDDLKKNKLVLCNKSSMDGLKYLRGIRLSRTYGLENLNEFDYDRNFMDIDTKFKALRLRNEVSKHDIKDLMKRNLLGTLVDKLREFDIYL